MTVATETSIREGFLVTITGTTPSAWSVDLCSVDMHMDGYQPHVLKVGDLPQDDAAFTRTSLILKNDAPYSRGSTSYASFAELARARDVIGATVEVSYMAWLRDGTTETSLRLTAQVVKVSKAGRSSITLELEQRGLSAMKLVPKRTINSSITTSEAVQRRIPDESNSSVIPVAMGLAVAHAPSGLYDLTSSQINATLVAGGVKPKGFPVREVQREEQKRYYAWEEDIGALDVESITGHSERTRKGYVYFSEVDAYATFYEQVGAGYIPNWAISDNPWAPDGSGLAWVAKTKRAPILQIPLLCSSCDVDASEGLTNPENAIDGRQETYATLAHRDDTAGGGYFFFPTGLPKLGRIITNTTDNGVGRQDLEQWEPRPAGIRIYCVTCAPPGETIPDYPIAMWPVFPFADDALFEVTEANVVVPSAVKGAQITTLTLPVCAADGHVGGQGDGWWGTKFHQWDLTSAGDEDQSDVHSSDFPLSLDNYLDVLPFRVKISNLSDNGAALHIQSVGVIVSFEWDGSPTLPYPVDWRSKKRDSEPYIAFVGPLTHDPAYTPSRHRNAWSRSAPGADRSTLPPPSSPSGIIVSSGSLIDDSAGTFSGVATLRPNLTNPSQYAHYYLRDYAGESVKIHASTDHGSWAYAEADLNWWEQRSDPTSSFRIGGSIDTQAPVADVIDSLFAGMPETALVKDADEEWSCHVWAPRAGGRWNPSRYYGDSATTPLEPEKYIVSTQDEGIQLWTDSGDMSEVRNEFEVAYDYDIGSGNFLRTATLKQQGASWVSDDGYGDPWPAAYGSGATAEAMAQWSYEHYGQVRRPMRVELHHVIHRPSAVGCCLYHLWRRYRLAPKIYFEATSAMSDLLMYQVFRFDNTLETYWQMFLPWHGLQHDTPDGADWDQNWWRVTKIDLRNEPAATILVEAEWIPDTIGGEVVAGFGGTPEVIGDLLDTDL